jgi:hypothetical protein
VTSSLDPVAPNGHFILRGLLADITLSRHKSLSGTFKSRAEFSRREDIDLIRKGPHHGEPCYVIVGFRLPWAVWIARYGGGDNWGETLGNTWEWEPATLGGNQRWWVGTTKMVEDEDT